MDHQVKSSDNLQGIDEGSKTKHFCTIYQHEPLSDYLGDINVITISLFYIIDKYWFIDKPKKKEHKKKISTFFFVIFASQLINL